MFHIVDVDNTLVFTDELNTAGYVHALAYMALEPRKVVPRTPVKSYRNGIPSCQSMT